jgi:hypothetical protein
MTLDIGIKIVAVLGTILVIYSQFVEAEHRRDLIRMIGAAAVLVYALSISNAIFITLAGGIFLAALVEFIEIATGRHHHRPIDVKTDRAV